MNRTNWESPYDSWWTLSLCMYFEISLTSRFKQFSSSSSKGSFMKNWLEYGRHSFTRSSKLGLFCWYFFINPWVTPIVFIMNSSFFFIHSSYSTPPLSQNIVYLVIISNCSFWRFLYCWIASISSDRSRVLRWNKITNLFFTSATYSWRMILLQVFSPTWSAVTAAHRSLLRSIPFSAP